GKRIRPALTLLSCQATGGDYQRALPAAMAIELLHNFTLIHDDIEDGDGLRRNRPAVWKIWGLAQALNVGDGMHVLAKRALLDGAAAKPELPVLLELATYIDETCLRLCEGQHLDLRYQEVWDVSVGQYLTMIGGKCAALIGCATYSGAALGTADRTVRDAYREFGEDIGLAFQIRDDLLAIWGEQAQTGKPSADLDKRKKTLPLIYAREHASPAAATRLQTALSGETTTESELADVYAILEDTGARQWTIQEAAGYCDRAIAALDATGIQHPSQAALRALAGFSVKRSY
ncbi:MAG: polyprenyl synthetase family protein, partial [Chloroflexi bacterium]|nr:polyprenyl synthetase family protein [Chloroflexota bacterium]